MSNDTRGARNIELVCSRAPGFEYGTGERWAAGTIPTGVMKGTHLERVFNLKADRVGVNRSAAQVRSLINRKMKLDL